MVHNQNDHVRNHLIEKMMPQVTPHKFLEVVFYVELTAQEEPDSKIVLKYWQIIIHLIRALNDKHCLTEEQTPTIQTAQAKETQRTWT